MDIIQHDGSEWNNLYFKGKDDAIFKVCQNLGECTIPEKKKRGLGNRARFWLFDIKGNKYAKNGAYIAGNAAPFLTSGGLYPAASQHRYYVNFWGENDCDSKELGKCAVKLNTDNLRDNQGLYVTADPEKKFRLSNNKDDTVKVTFKEVSCST